MTIEQITKLGKLIGRHYCIIDKEETELIELEKDLEEILGCYVRCGYDCIWSHKHKEEKRETDFIINYELYETAEDWKKANGGYDGEVHEIFYLKGNGNYIVITEV